MNITLLLLLFIFAIPSALAQSSVTDGVLINADSMFRDTEKRTVRLEGNVQVVFQGQHLSCDRARLDLKKQTIEADGNVILSSERAHIEGERIVFNYKQNTGVIYKGFVQSGQVVFEGDLVEKTGDKRYLATNAVYTACDTCPPGWSFSGKKIDAEIGGYARIQRPVFKVAGVPIMILPGIIVPLKSARQSGFLVPFMDGSKKGGLAPGESYFWAIDKSQDLTTTAQVFANRGFKAKTDYRYVLSENSRGRLQGAWLQDKVFSKDNNITDTFDRWFTTYSHHHELPNNYVHRVDFVGLSDLHYLRDFPEEVSGQGDAALENRMSVSKTTEGQAMSAEASAYTNLLKTNPLAPNDDVVNRFPEIKYSLKETQLGERGPLFGLDLNYVNFVRQKYNYDDLISGTDNNGNSILQPIGTGARNSYPLDIERDGKYDPSTDKFRTGQRLDIRPSLSYPFQIAKKFDIMPKISFRETQYRFYPTDAAENPATTTDPGFAPTAARRYIQNEIVVKTEFSRVYGSTTDPQANRWKHSIEPELGYSHIPWKREPNHPFFGDFDNQQYSRQYEAIGDSDINGVNGLQFDYEDRTYNKQVIDLGLTNRFTRKVWRNGSPDYETATLFRLSQSYDMNEAEDSTPHPWSNVNGLLDARFQHFETYTTASYNGYAKVTDIATRVKGLVTPQNYLEIAYTRNFKVNSDYSVAGETRNVSFGGGLTSRFLEARGQINLEAKDFGVLSWDYLLNFSPPGKCWSIKFGQTLVVGGDPKYRFAFNFDFGGENKPKVFRE